MKKYKVEFRSIQYFTVDVLAENEDQAQERAIEKWEDGQYQEDGDPQTELRHIYDVTNTDDPFNA